MDQSASFVSLAPCKWVVRRQQEVTNRRVTFPNFHVANVYFGELIYLSVAYAFKLLPVTVATMWHSNIPAIVGDFPGWLELT